ncbi:MAG: MBL fold metallo-hydrolase [Candidatus Omnitrophica bacterium]|nr:MBL fold metallo-hydrolase [Candidatus Omnitrophota bacterium]
MARLTFYGVRGSYPVSGPRYRRHGGQTTCMALETPRGFLVVDAGTGMAALAEELCRRSPIPPVTLLFTHFHLDHVAGITAFRAFLGRKVRITLMADPVRFPGWPGILRTLTHEPLWPIDPLRRAGGVELRSLPRDGAGLELCGVKVSWCPVWHPQGCASYRFSADGLDVVLASDREHGDRKMDAAFLKFCRGADVLVHDAQFTPAEHRTRVGWGHSTPEAAARTAAQAQAGSLILTSHDPMHTDRQVQEMADRARRIFRRTAAAREGMRVDADGGMRS